MPFYRTKSFGVVERDRDLNPEVSQYSSKIEVVFRMIVHPQYVQIFERRARQV